MAPRSLSPVNGWRRMRRLSRISHVMAERLDEALQKPAENQRKLFAELDRNRQLLQLTSRVGIEAANSIRSNETLENQFRSDAAVPAYVVSIDIRRSTYLMLKAAPADFFRFISVLFELLAAEIKRRHGIVDKFTGDGLLAFFPEFFSGTDAGFRAIKAAASCHEAFRRHYAACRDSFTCVPADTGLGTGIDFGGVHIMWDAHGLTVVGPPVVYACRLGDAPAGKTVVNRQAFVKLRPYHESLRFDECRVEPKNEPPLMVHSVEPIGEPALADPDWLAKGSACTPPNAGP